MNIPAKKLPGALCGCVLAGGRSTRMGCDKALLPHSGKRTLLDQACATLSGICSRVFVASAPGRNYAPYHCIFDEIPGLGPISGIIQGLETARNEYFCGIIALACDLPLMTGKLLAELAGNAPQNAAGAFYLNPVSQKVEMLAGIYRLSALPLLQGAARAGRYGLYRALSAAWTYVAPLPPENISVLSNCNTRDDLAKIRLAARPS